MDFNAPIRFFNRHTQQEETEQVLGEKSIQFIYGHPLGRLALHTLVKRSLFSHFFGWLKNRPASKKDIASFIKQYGVPTEEILLPLESFSSFNEFFYRKLKEEARPLAEKENPNVAIFPTDGRHMGFADISQASQVFVKGQSFDLKTLLGDTALAERYAHGTLIFSRLCPVDYHRFHFPVAGIVGETQLFSGVLGSVSPYALRRRLAWLWANKRTLTLLQTEQWGQVALLDVGATCVGSIFQTFRPGTFVQKGDEKGYFAFGGSTVLTLFEPGRITLAEDLLENTAQGRELYAQMGSYMGHTPSSPSPLTYS